jgi:malonyl-CoA O-methyltransferase
MTAENAWSRRRQIEQAFSAASGYDRHARVQRPVARRLAARIAALPLPAAPRVLEIGCGTGFLTEALIDHRIGGDWLITDISPEMLERTRRRVGDGAGRRFAVLDGEYGEPGGPFDLICSSLVMQWFDDHEAALARMLRWLAPGGHCVFATLGAQSFAEWRAAHEAEGVSPGTPRFPSAVELSAMLPGAQAAAHRVERYRERHDSALAFLRALKAIGAHTAARRHRPLPASALRRVMRRFENHGAAVSYEVVTCHYRRA